MLRVFAAGFATISVLATSVLATSAFASDRAAEVMHFWVSGSEHAALDVVKREFIQRGGVWSDNPQKSNLDLRRVLTDRLTTGTAPTALQWQGGAELHEMVEIGMIDNYDSLAQKNNWDAVLPDPVKDRIKVDGHYFLAPTGVHSENWIFYNLNLLHDNNIRPPRSMDELIAASTQLVAAGIVPIALGKADWEARVMFISVLLSVLGRDDFSRLVEHGTISVLDKPSALDAIKVFYRLTRTIAVETQRPADWAEAVAAVGAGRSAFIFQGDWAKGELMKLGYRNGADFGCMLVPGTENVLSIVVDTFAFPRSLATAATTQRDLLIETILDPKIQRQFNNIKGSIPARIDISEGSLDPCGAIAERLLQTPRAVITQPVQTMSTALVSDLHILISRMINEQGFKEEQALEQLKIILGSGLVELKGG